MVGQPAAWLRAARSRRRGVGVLIVALVANACGPAPPPMDPLPEPGSVAFQNTTISPVRVYLVELPDAIRSLSEPTQNLVQMHWVLTGEQLFSLPTPRASAH